MTPMACCAAISQGQSDAHYCVAENEHMRLSDYRHRSYIQLIEAPGAPMAGLYITSAKCVSGFA